MIDGWRGSTDNGGNNMRTASGKCTPVAALAPTAKLALGAALAAIGGTSILLSLTLGWTELPGPWSFILGFCGGLSGGAGVALAVCGLVRFSARGRRQ